MNYCLYIFLWPCSRATLIYQRVTNGIWGFSPWFSFPLSDKRIREMGGWSYHHEKLQIVLMVISCRLPIVLGWLIAHYSMEHMTMAEDSFLTYLFRVSGNGHGTTPRSHPFLATFHDRWAASWPVKTPGVRFQVMLAFILPIAHLVPHLQPQVRRWWFSHVWTTGTVD